MDYDKCLDLLYEAEEQIWFHEVLKARSDGSLCAWATSLHPRKLPCRLDGGFLNGSYNLGQKLLFEYGTALLLRFPRLSSVSGKYADEKVAMEVEALCLVRERTTIPVPEVWGWGLADANPLHLGPFILMGFIDGVCLRDILTKSGSRVSKEGFPDDKLQSIYRQMAKIMFQLFKIDFDRIGSLPTANTKFAEPLRPLTWKVHDTCKQEG